MKKILSLFAALIVAVSMWGETVTLTENFASSGATSDAYNCSSSASTAANQTDWDYTWTPVSGYVFKSGIRIGTGSAVGSLTNSTMLASVPTGTEVTVKIYAAQWNTDGKDLKLTYNGSSETKAPSNSAITTTSNTYSASDFSTSTNFTITKANTVNDLVVATSGKGRVFIDKIVVTYTADDSGDDDCTSSITITKGVETNGTFTLSQSGEVCIDEGNASVDVTATPAAHYYLQSVNTTSGTAGEISDNQCTVSGISANTTITCVFAEYPKHNAHFSVNGVIDNNNDKVVYEEEAITFPADPTDIYGKKFQGWTKTPDYSNATTAPGDLCKAANMGNTDVTFYAVFATQIEGAATLTKLGSSAVFSAGDNIAIFAKSGENYYGLYQETVSSSYVSYYVLDHTPTAADIDDSKKYVTLEAASTGKWYLGDATNGYLYNNSNNMYASTNNGEKTEYTIAWNSTNSAFTIKNGSRWVACRADLTGDNQYKYRGAGTSSNPTTNSLGYLELYLYDTPIYRSDYSTTVIATSEDINISAAGYATYYNADFAFTMPEGLEGIVVYAINGNTLELRTWYDEGEVVPAGEPLILHGAVGPYTLFAGETSEASLKSTGENLLSGTSTAAEWTTGGDVYYRLSQHDGQVGFYWGAAEGAAFQPGANKAYLAISNTSAPAHFLFEDTADVATSVESVEANENAVKFFENGQIRIMKNGVVYNVLGTVVR